MTAALIDGPPLWPAVALGALAAVGLAVAVVVTLVRAYRAPVTAVDRACAALDDEWTEQEHWAVKWGRERRAQSAGREARREAFRVVADEQRVRETLSPSAGRVENVVPRRVRA